MLDKIIDFIMYVLLGLDSSNFFIKSLNYFVYDSLKIILLLFFMIAVVGYLRSYLTKDWIKKFLRKTNEGLGNFFASIFGVITPFCSCSSIPIFLSFLELGVPLGVTFSFLITSPLVNEYLIILMFGSFGWKVTSLYVLFGILIGTISGMILGRLNLNKYISKEFVPTFKKESSFKSQKQRIIFGFNESKKITKSLWLWILFGVLLGALIHNFVPDTLVQSVIYMTGIFGVPLAVLIGVPIYGSCAAIIPIAVVLFEKGVPLGTALAFMMSISALSLPQIIILKKAMNWKLISIFYGIVIVGMILAGYFINYIEVLL